MRLFTTITIILILLSTPLFSQQCNISGTITDANTHETLVGATVVIQGTNQGTITDFDGNYRLDKLNPGIYNIVVSFVSYDPQISKVDLRSSNSAIVNVDLKSASLDIGEVNVTARRRDNTEMALLSALKVQNLIVSGISAQQIAKSQDKDAAEVIRRVPGITITNGKFVVVRGLIERYNSVMLNNVTAPSFEADKRAFSFDAIPSGMINNIMIYKSPAPELPADFAGAAINIETKDVADENSLVISYSTSYIPNATFNSDFETYKGSKTDWLGWDDGTRKIPDGVPGTSGFEELYTWEDVADYLSKADDIIDISKKFSNNWNTFNKSPFLDQSLSIASQRRFVLGKVTLGNLTAFTYGHNNTFWNRQRTEYEGLNEYTNEMDLDFDFTDKVSQQSAKMGFIHNWNILYGKNQKLEFRNFLNQMGTTSTNIRNGINYYNVETVRLYDLKFVSRLVYSGQLAGEQHWNSDRTKLNWTAGYGYTKNSQPDNRRLTYVQDIIEGSEREGQYSLKIQNQPNAYLAGRLWLGMTEKIYDAKVDFEHNFYPGGSEQPWVIKAGAFYEKKDRSFHSRLIGVIATKTPKLDLYSTASELFVPENFYLDTIKPYNDYGFSYDDITRSKDSYDAYDNIQAGYISLKIPVTAKLTLYGGVRAERFNRLITNFYDPTPTPELYDITRDTIDFFPSVNVSYNINEKNLLRASYGKTINRPEFREMSNFDYQDFDMFVLYHGNDTLKNAYINNFDLRYEWYPSAGEIVSVAAFYKQFTNPIEIFLIPAGTGYDYKPYNTEKAYSMGVEIDVRKQLTEFENANNVLRYLKDLTVIFNTSLIKSEIETNLSFARETNRIMQGQSPYIVNLGLNYQNPDNGLTVNVSYNNIGKRIAYAGTPLNPHTWELSRNSLDLTIQKQLGKRTTVKLGIKDILNNPVEFAQYYGENNEVEVPTVYYIPNRTISVGVSIKL